MIYDYDAVAMREALSQRLAQALSPAEWGVLEQRQSRFRDEKNIPFFNLTFTAIPRLVKKNGGEAGASAGGQLPDIRHGFSVAGWTTDRLARTWWVLQLPADKEAEYVRTIENLFKAAEINEQVALYGALPLLAYPGAFQKRAAEGLRTNIRQVFEAIALNNPYPADHLEEAAWNQMVLKSFFMGIAVNRIIGLDERGNGALAHILSDYAHERWAAGRPVSPLLWRPVGRFIDERIFPDIERLFQSENEQDRKAAALACGRSSFRPAVELLQRNDELSRQATSGALTWEMLERA